MNIFFIFVTPLTFHSLISLLNTEACENIYSIFITLFTSQALISLLKVFLPSNKYDISVTAETFQVLITPYVAVAAVSSTTHASTDVTNPALSLNTY